MAKIERIFLGLNSSILFTDKSNVNCLNSSERDFLREKALQVLTIDRAHWVTLQFDYLGDKNE